jgi:hypothetical protein
MKHKGLLLGSVVPIAPGNRRVSTGVTSWLDAVRSLAPLSINRHTGLAEIDTSMFQIGNSVAIS